MEKSKAVSEVLAFFSIQLGMFFAGLFGAFVSTSKRSCEWWFAPNFVYHKDYTLERDGNRKPIDGWEWHDKAPLAYIEWENNQINK